MRRTLTLLLAVLLLAAVALPARAEQSTDLSIRLVYGRDPLPGGIFDIYRVGEENARGELSLTGAFAGYPVDLNGAGEDTGAQAAALYAFAQRDALTPDIQVTTGQQGIAVVNDLQPGLYLVAGQDLVADGYRYRTEPQLILLPQKDPSTGAVVTDLTLRMKSTQEPYSPEPVSRKVLKIWDDHSGNFRPESVTVHLLKNGVVYDTVTLTARNQWRHTWENLDPDALWQITEEVPQGYTVKVEQDGTTFLLTNSAPEEFPTEPTEPETTEPETTEPTKPSEPTKPTKPTEPTKPTKPQETTAPRETEPEETTPPASSEGKIPQTGTLWWPVLAMAAVGLALILAGFFKGRRRVLWLLGIALLAGSLYMTTDAMKQRKEAQQVSQTVLTRLELPEIPEVTETPALQAPAEEIPDYQYNPHMEMPEQIVDGTAYVGTLEIPALSLELPVAGSTTRENLQKAPCRYSGTPYTADLVLGAHNYAAHFGGLRQLPYGEEVRMTDLDGNVFSYRVTDIEILQPEQLEDLLSGGWPLTLYTCTPGGQSRVVVRCA